MAVRFTCSLDASKAFDRVNHRTLFKKLDARGVPGYILRILIYWYKNQDMCIRWGDAYSAKFKVTNGVRQGGILSPHLFNVYVDEMSEELNKCNVGCNINEHLINHIMYADDLVPISPSSAGLSQLLHECEKFGTRHDLKYNAKKSAVMIYRSMTLKLCTIPQCKLNGLILHVFTSYSQSQQANATLSRHLSARRKGTVSAQCYLLSTLKQLCETFGRAFRRALKPMPTYRSTLSMPTIPISLAHLACFSTTSNVSHQLA